MSRRRAVRTADTSGPSVYVVPMPSPRSSAHAWSGVRAASTRPLGTSPITILPSAVVDESERVRASRSSRCPLGTCLGSTPISCRRFPEESGPPVTLHDLLGRIGSRFRRSRCGGGRLPDALIVLTIRRRAARTSGATATVISPSLLSPTPHSRCRLRWPTRQAREARCDFPRPPAVTCRRGHAVAQGPQPAGQVGELEGIPAQHVVWWRTNGD